MPTDRFQRQATLALRGDFGPLRPWQREAYEAGLRWGVRATTPLIVTQYNGKEKSGKVDGSGVPCTLRTAASNKIRRNTYIWTEETGVRQVLDSGSHANDGKAAGLGGTWVDAWYPTAGAAARAGINGWTPLAGAVIR